MARYWRNGWVRTGALILPFGSAPLLGNPNPVGPGILAGFTFWPGVIVPAVGAHRVRAGR